MTQFNILAGTRQITKTDAGYVHRDGVDYRCRECWKFLPSQNACASLQLTDTVRANGTCILWEIGPPRPGLMPLGCFEKDQVGYTENPNGTKCYRCVMFLPSGACMRVDKNSPGDDPKRIDRNGCCNSQSPRP